jgi:hypothetical protein
MHGSKIKIKKKKKNNSLFYPAKRIIFSVGVSRLAVDVS